MSTTLETRRRAAQRAPQGAALQGAVLLLGLAAAVLMESLALAPPEPAAEEPARPQPARASVTGDARAAALPEAEVSPAPVAVSASSAAAAPGWDKAPQAAGDPPRAGTERAFYEQDLRLAARPGALAERARQLFVGGGGS